VAAKPAFTNDEPKSAALKLAEEVRRHPFTAAAIVGSAAAASASVYLGARAMARRNQGDGRSINSVMKSAITACEAAQACKRDTE
jgi:hypothetical protein